MSTAYLKASLSKKPHTPLSVSEWIVELEERKVSAKITNFYVGLCMNHFGITLTTALIFNPVSPLPPHTKPPIQGLASASAQHHPMKSIICIEVLCRVQHRYSQSSMMDVTQAGQHTINLYTLYIHNGCDTSRSTYSAYRTYTSMMDVIQAGQHIQHIGPIPP